MKKWLMFVLFASLLFVLGACGGGDTDDTGSGDTDTGTEEPADDGAVDSAAGEEVFQANCSACHGADLSGGAGPDLTQVGSRYSADEIADIVTNGKGNMPPVNVTGDDLDALSTWLAEQK
ncbi:cytochrome c551 [Oceanobacillus massiliensis]|uniref:cytochrome c551 n=1 Tax=Oceanobacillus massiliensis TaxID=1465765 RepID=UPI000288128A|nr:cytochrome c [Oceanobacillus massiliensis]